MMDELLKKLEAKGKPKLSKEETQAKLEVVQELLEMAQDAMAQHNKMGMDELMAPKKEAMVKVSAENPDDLKKGLDMAKEVVDQKEMHSEDSDLEKLEEAMGKDLDADKEEGESEEHKAKVLGEEEATEEEDEDEEEKKKKDYFGML